MSINCTDNCQYQTEGVCTLNELSSPSLPVNSDKIDDCPYFNPVSLKK